MSFLLVLGIAHLPVALVAALLVWRWHGRLRKPVPATHWLLYVIGSGLMLAAATLLGTFVLLTYHYHDFALLRFWAQALFGEILLTLAVVGGMHLVKRGTGRPPRWRGILLGVPALLLLAVYTDAYHHCPYDLQVRRHSLDLTRGAPRSGTLRILHLTDLQTHAVREYERNALRKAASLTPDLIVFTGDYIQSRYRPTRKQAGADLRAFLQQEPLRARYGVYAVQGDVEDRDWTALFEGTGIRCLTDETVTVPLEGGKALTLTGLSLWKSREDEAEKLMAVVGKAGPGALHLVFGHAPDFVSALPEGSGIDLALAGHTHGGQVVLPGYGPVMTMSRLPRKYAGGLNWFGEVPLHVSRGIGMERGLAPQIRFFCPPEICLLEVKY